MSINVVVLDGVVKSLALRYDAEAKAELRFTLQATDHATDGKPWVSYWPCCASGNSATRLAEMIEDGQHIVVTSGQLCYRKRLTKLGEQSRLEVLVWQVDRLSASPGADTSPGTLEDSASGEVTCNPEPASVPATKKARQPRLPKASRLTWSPENAN